MSITITSLFIHNDTVCLVYVGMCTISVVMYMVWYSELVWRTIGSKSFLFGTAEFSLWASGAGNYDYIITNSINSLLIGSRCIPNGAHTNHCLTNLARASKLIKNSGIFLRLFWKLRLYMAVMLLLLMIHVYIYILFIECVVLSIQLLHFVLNRHGFNHLSVCT